MTVRLDMDAGPDGWRRLKQVDKEIARQLPRVDQPLALLGENYVAVSPDPNTMIAGAGLGSAWLVLACGLGRELLVIVCCLLRIRRGPEMAPLLREVRRMA